MTGTDPSLGLADFGPALEPSSPGGLVMSRMEEQSTGLFQAFPTAKKEEWVVSLTRITSNIIIIIVIINLCWIFQ